MTELTKETLQSCAHAFRLGQEALACQLWGQLVSAMAANENLMADGRFQALLPQMLAAQERKDWLGLADDIEYELCEMWQSLHPKGPHR